MLRLQEVSGTDSVRQEINLCKENILGGGGGSGGVLQTFMTNLLLDSTSVKRKAQKVLFKNLKLFFIYI